MLKVFVVFFSLFLLIVTSLLEAAKAQHIQDKQKACHRFLPSGDQASFSPLVHLTACEK